MATPATTGTALFLFCLCCLLFPLVDFVVAFSHFCNYILHIRAPVVSLMLRVTEVYQIKTSTWFISTHWNDALWFFSYTSLKLKVSVESIPHVCLMTNVFEKLCFVSLHVWKSINNKLIWWEDAEAVTYRWRKCPVLHRPLSGDRL